MATQIPTLPMMAGVPSELRGRIVSGMRWTFWLSALAVPFSYGTSILLARTGPEVIGTYGLLMVYIGIVASVFYFGGDAVVIKFVPALEQEKRFPFLFTYSLIVLGFVVVGIVAAAAWPRGLHYLFGDAGGQRFQLEMLCLSPLYVVFSLVVAAHKAVLEMRWAHLLMRVLTIGSFVFYGLLFAGWKSLLAAHYVGLIWGVYLGLTLLATVAGLWHLLELKQWEFNWRDLHLFLPERFWSYTLSTEQVSAVSFFIQRLDLILVMNYGGVVALGEYVVIITVAETIRTANRFFFDALLPSLTNTLDQKDRSGASQIFAMNLRLLFVVNIVGVCAVLLLLEPLMALFGPQYVSLRVPFTIAVLFAGLSAPGMTAGTLLSSVGRQQEVAYVYLGQVLAFLGLFTSLWSRWKLVGAVVAAGIAAVLSSAVLLVVAKRISTVYFSVGKDYLKFGIASVMAAVLMYYPTDLATGSHLCISLISIIGFLVSARYSARECKILLSCFVPGGMATSLGMIVYGAEGRLQS